MAIWNDIEAGMAYLEQRTEDMRKDGYAAAQADVEYRIAKAKAILEERSNGTPATIAKEVIYARPDVQQALLERNCSQAIHEADKEAINSMKLKLRILDAQLARDWQASGERGY